MAPYFSPIRINRVTPMKTGKGILNISFFNALYAEGVQELQIDLRILKHEENYMIADLIYDHATSSDRAALISRIEFDWMRQFCPKIWSTRPPRTLSRAAQESVSAYLDELFTPD